MNKATTIAVTIAAMSVMPGFADINIDSDNATVATVVYDLIEIEGLNNQLFLANEHVPGRNFIKVDDFRVARRGAWSGNALPFELTIKQNGSSGKNYILNNSGTPSLNLEIAVRDKQWAPYTVMSGEGTGVTFVTRKGFMEHGNNMQVQYTISEEDFMAADRGGYISKFVFKVAAL